MSDFTNFWIICWSAGCPYSDPFPTETLSKCVSDCFILFASFFYCEEEISVSICHELQMGQWRVAGRKKISVWFYQLKY